MLTQHELQQMARLHELWKEGQPDGQFADFSGMKLANLDFDGMDFEAASFRGAKIRDSCLCGNYMSADFRGAELQNIFAGYALYENANFTDATCRGCDFTQTEFDGARLRRADFGDANLSYAVLECCDMTGAKLDNAMFHCTATAGSWGRIPPARDGETVLAEGRFIAAMLKLGFGDEGKITEWMDEAWSLAQDQTYGDEPKLGPREPEYRNLLSSYAAVFTHMQEQFPAATETLYSHGEGFSPEELPSAAEYIAGGGSLETAQHMEWDGLFQQEPDKIVTLLNMKDATESAIAETLSSAENGEALLNLDELMVRYGIDSLYETSLYKMIRERPEVAKAQLDLEEDTIALELKPEFLMEQSDAITMAM